MASTSLYIHIPFCVHRCGYCDFNTYAGLEGLIPGYVQAVSRELEFIAHSASEPIEVGTIYFGGGTPSLLAPVQLETVLQTVRKYFPSTPSQEITLEANPGTVSPEYLLNLRQLGVNRLSLGLQSALPGELKLLQRQHTFEDVTRAVDWARQAGFANLNLDLIFGLPGQLPEEWMQSVEAALTLHPEHLSLYALTLEHGTPLQHQVANGEVASPEEDTAADMYEWSRERLEKAGFVHYEISNWAYAEKQGEELYCRHNLQYWRGLPYLGVGAGAHGFIDHHRTENVASPKAYIQRMSQAYGDACTRFPATPATTQLNWINKEAEIGEWMMMGLRLVREGISSQEFQARFGKRLQDRFGTQIERALGYGLLEWAGESAERLRLTKKGQLLGNQVFREFI